MYMQSQKVITRTNTDTDTIQMYPYSVSVVVKIPTDPNVATEALQAARKELVAFMHQLLGPYSFDTTDWEPSSELLQKLASGQTEALLTVQDIFPEG
jgi:hypothetical protein